MTDRMVTEVGEVLEDEAMRRVGRDLGTMPRAARAAAGAAAALRVIADEIDQMTPGERDALSQLVRERAAGLQAVVDGDR